MTSCNENHIPYKKEHNSAYLSNLTDSAERFKQQGNTEQAIQYHKKALIFAQKNNHRKAQAHTLLQIAKLLPRKDADTSLMYLKSALDIAHNIRHYELQTNIYRSIAEIHKQQHDYNAAIYALEAQNMLTDSLLEERRIKDIRHLKSERDVNEERSLALAIVVSLLIITLMLAYFFIRTRRLNLKLAQSVAVKNKLFSIISHDLRGPAGSLKQAHELIDLGAIPEDELPDFLRMVKKQSVILNDTLDSLLMWSRSQLYEIQTNPENFDVSDSIVKTVNLLDGLSAAKNLRISNNIKRSTRAYLDKNQFEFILRNILSNAIKFSHRDGLIEIDVKEHKNSLELMVRDHGIGISPERQKQFCSGGLETTFGTSGEKGTGLGLRMVCDFIGYLGGKIQLTSTVGDTCFKLIFPKKEIR